MNKPLAAMVADLLAVKAGEPAKPEPKAKKANTNGTYRSETNCKRCGGTLRYMSNRNCAECRNKPPSQKRQKE